MLTALSTLLTTRPRRALAVAGIAFAVTGVIGGPTAALLNASNAFADQGSQSARAEKLLVHAAGVQPSPGVVAVVLASPAAPAVSQVAGELRAVPGVATVAPPVPSSDGGATVVAATLRAGADDAKVTKAATAAVGHRHDVLLGGAAVAGTQVGKQATADLGIAEAIAFPVLAVLALLIFRGLATLLPLGVGGLAVLASFTLLRLVNVALPLSSFALNLVIGLGLGLAVDYCLFLVWRFREQLAAGHPVDVAVRTTVATTGRTVLFSAGTVAAAMACLTVFPQRFLVSMGIGGVTVALTAAAAALTVVPAFLALFGTRLARPVPAAGSGAWYRLAQAVMRRPVVVAASTIAVMVALAWPATSVRWSGVDSSVLPSSQSASVAAKVIDARFPALHGTSPTVIAARAGADAGPALDAYATRLAAVPGVAAVGTPAQVAPDLWRIVVGGNADPISPAAQHTVRAVRAVPAPVPVLVGGAAADFADQGHAIASHLPLAIGLLALLTLVLLWLLTGSVVLPIKALLMNALTTAAATGLLVLTFQDGRLSSLLAYHSQHGIEETDFMVFATIVFALSTDYGVFLLARIREQRLRAPGVAGGERAAVAAGLQATGRLITSASVLLAVAIGAFGLSKLVFLKEVGLGTAAAVLLDAFVVRALLVPSLMALLGKANWWSPTALRRLHDRFGDLEGPAAADPVVGGVPATV